jgi:hypothetical protein
MNGIERIAAERQRQIDEEGRTSAHDDQHTNEQLAYAAAYYVLPESAVDRFGIEFDLLWPWPEPRPIPAIEHSRIRELEKAGALIAAEIDRLLRLKVRKP